jgi:hypothetical protein
MADSYLAGLPQDSTQGLGILLMRLSLDRELWRDIQALGRNPREGVEGQRLRERVRTELRERGGVEGISPAELLRFCDLVSGFTWRQIVALSAWGGSGFSLKPMARAMNIGIPAASRIIARAKLRLARNLEMVATKC